MKVHKKTRPQVTYSDPALLYVVVDRHTPLDKSTLGMVNAVSAYIAEVWLVRIDDELTAQSQAKNYYADHIGVMTMSRGEFLRRMSTWSQANKPTLMVPHAMLAVLEPHSARFGKLMAYRSIKGLYDFLKDRGVAAKNSVREVTYSDTNPAAPRIQRGLTLFDIKKPSALDMQTFLAKWSARSLSRPAFLKMLEDAARLYSIPVEPLIQMAKWEFFGLRRQVYPSDFMGGYKKHYAGPFQIGASHYSNTRTIFAPLYKVRVPVSRKDASLGVQAASTIDYVRRAANNSKTLARSPLSSIGFYLVHNQGPGGAVRIINNQIDAETARNLAAQSSEVKAALRSNYGVRA